MFWRHRKKSKSNALIWIDDGACRRGLAAETGRIVGMKQPVIMITHFSGTHNWVSELLNEQEIGSNLISDPAGLAPGRLMESCRDGAVALVPFPLLRLRPEFGADPATPRGKAAILIPEIYPTRGRDEEVEAFADGLPFETTVTYFVSLQSPLMLRFGGQRTVETMQRLGFDESQAIEHPWLLKSVIRTQKKVGKATSQDTPATDQEEWFEINAPQLKTKS